MDQFCIPKLHFSHAFPNDTEYIGVPLDGSSTNPLWEDAQKLFLVFYAVEWLRGIWDFLKDLTNDTVLSGGVKSLFKNTTLTDYFQKMCRSLIVVPVVNQTTMQKNYSQTWLDLLQTWKDLFDFADIVPEKTFKHLIEWKLKPMNQSADHRWNKNVATIFLTCGC